MDDSNWRRQLRLFANSLFNLVGLRNKIMGIIFLVVFIFGGLAVWQVRQSFISTMRRQLDRQGVSVARDVAARSVDYIYTNNIFGLYLLIKDTMKYSPEVRYVFILSPNGQVLVSSFGRGVPAGLIDVNHVADTARYHLQQIMTGEGLVHDVAVPVAGGRAGVVRVGMSEKGLWATVAQLTRRLLLTILLATLTGVGAAFALTVVVSRPIMALVRAAKAVTAGDMNYRVSLDWARDEIGQLGVAFNRMMDSLQEYHTKVRDFSRELVQRNEQLQQVSAELLRKEEMRTYLLNKVITAQEEERRRIARELHDQTSQSLTSLMVGLKSVEEAADLDEVRQGVADLRLLTTGILEEVHDLAVELRPSVLDDLGLPAALQRYCRDSARRYGLDVDLHMDGFQDGARLKPQVETALYRVLQEAVTNVAKHAQASCVSVIVERRDDGVLAIVEDDGKGFDVERTMASSVDEKKLGLFGMQERVALLEGKMTIESQPGQGTTLYFQVPLAPGKEETGHGEDPLVAG